MIYNWYANSVQIHSLTQNQSKLQQRLDIAKSHLENADFYKELPVECKLPLEDNKTE